MISSRAYYDAQIRSYVVEIFERASTRLTSPNQFYADYFVRWWKWDDRTTIARSAYKAHFVPKNWEVA